MRHRRRTIYTVAVAIWILIAGFVRAAVPTLTVRDVGPGWDATCIDVRGVAAGAFDPTIWQHNTLNLVPDIRRPVIVPGEGKHRNIYAPSVVEIAGGYRIYYGGWDGVDTPNDRIYCIDTGRDFLDFHDRHTVVDHGAFQHVCNVNVTPAAEGYAMMCTAYPDANGRNKPVTFFSHDGVRWNPQAKAHDIIELSGYVNYLEADINGINVLLFECGTYRMYFGNFRDGGKTWRTTGGDGRRFKLDGVVLQPSALVNDVKKFRTAGGHDWYLMGLHANGDRLFFSISDDDAKFPEAQTLCTNVGDLDRYMVSLGWITQGAQGEPGRRLLGLVYGAGAKPSLDANRIYARWLQKKLVITASGKMVEPKTEALGPHRQLLFVGKGKTLNAWIELFSEDGKTSLGRTADSVEMKPGRAYQVMVDRAGPAGAGKSP